jgi:hypothetical protein
MLLVISVMGVDPVTSMQVAAFGTAIVVPEATIGQTLSSPRLLTITAVSPAGVYEKELVAIIVLPVILNI